MSTQLLLIALATFASEDLTCIGAGVLISQGKLAPVPGVLACLFGIFAGDMLLYIGGRLAGVRLLRRLPAERVERASAWLNRRGAGVILASRFVPGMRLPTYLAAGFLRTRFWLFAGHFLLAAAIWTPLLVAASALLGAGVSRYTGAAAAFVVLIAAAFAIRKLPPWEFWPPWLAYLPLVPYLLRLAVRYRSLTLFTAANPGIPSGGFAGESKSQILRHLDCVPRFDVISTEAAPAQRIAQALAFTSSFPVVLKPDAGERGRDVAIIRSESELRQYFTGVNADTIIQEYVAGLEFGIFYVRHPGEQQGRIFSITEKRFPEIAGDGRSTVAELIRRDPRARRLAKLYLARCRRGPDSVPAAGERVRLAEIGSHCRGAIFLNGGHLETEALRGEVDRIARLHPGFYFGRFDVRAASVEDLQAGRFSVLELNGVTSEATHIYDPAVSVLEAYRVLFRQWRIAFEIGAANRAAGARVTGAAELLRIARHHSDAGSSARQRATHRPSARLSAKTS
jgi:membrane protein DedA with SNARE-associated domain